MRTTLNTIVAFVGLLANNDATFVVAVTLLLIINIVPLFAPKND